MDCSLMIKLQKQMGLVLITVMVIVKLNHAGSMKLPRAADAA